MKIRAILEAVHSKPDRYGNCYWFFIFTDTAHGITLMAKVGSLVTDANIRGILRLMRFDHGEYYYVVRELPIREFERQTKRLDECGDQSQEMVSYIGRHLTTLIGASTV